MPVRLIITATDDGQINVEGPIQNRPFCYGLLESAKDAIRDFSKEQAEKRVQLAPPGTVIAPVANPFGDKG